MSRIDDADRDANRAVARKEVRKLEDQQRAHRRAPTTAFAKLMPADLSAPREPRGAQSRLEPKPGARQHGDEVQEPRRATRTGEDASKSRSAEPAGAAVEPTGGARERREGDAGADSSPSEHKEGDASPGFRFNPALMAPTPVAKPKSAASSERFRMLAAEIAQKIVERVLVGTNRSGRAEFQIDLRGDVLAGLSIRISAGDGKIQASFSASDRAVATLLRKNADGLKKALGSRGLTLEELRIEERS